MAARMASSFVARIATLTPRQRDIYEFLKDNIMNRGYGPTVREIGNEFGIISCRSVSSHLDAIVKRGLITREPNLSRSIQLSDKPQRKTAVEIRGQFGQGAKLRGTWNSEQVDFMDLLGSGDHFCYRVADDLMVEEGIFKSDFLICRMQQFYRDGDCVIAVIENKEAYYRRFFKDENQIRLEKISDPNDAIFTKNVRIIGIVIGVIRKL